MSLPNALANSIRRDGAESTLVAQRCRQCATVLFPAGCLCARCGGTSLEQIDLSGRGRIWSWTMVHRAPAGMKVPYFVAWVDFPEGPRLFGQVSGKPGNLRTGMEVSLAFGLPPSGKPDDAYYFIPLTTAVNPG